MQVYTSEYLKAIEDIEEKVERSLISLTHKLNNDSMIECRNYSIGDLLFDNKNLNTNSITMKADISQQLTSLTGGRKTKEQITNSIIEVVEQTIMEFIEEEINKSKIKITNLSDVRKIVKVAFDGGVFIDIKESKLFIYMRVGVIEKKKKFSFMKWMKELKG